MQFRLAAPSCVIPDRLGPNCRALAPVVGEVGLMLLETESCLAYDHRDLPDDLAELGLSYHAHLPLDLPWGDGSAATILTSLTQKISFLRPHSFVLHPPQPGTLPQLVASNPDFAPVLCLENTGRSDLSDLWGEIHDLGLGVCLDLGHLVSYGQENMLCLPGIFDRIRILHVYGGESGRGHAGLDALPDPSVLKEILQRVRPDCVLVVELFSMNKLLDSLALLRSWLDAWGMAHD